MYLKDQYNSMIYTENMTIYILPEEEESILLAPWFRNYDR